MAVSRGLLDRSKSFVSRRVHREPSPGERSLPGPCSGEIVPCVPDDAFCVPPSAASASPVPVLASLLPLFPSRVPSPTPSCASPLRSRFPPGSASVPGSVPCLAPSFVGCLSPLPCLSECLLLSFLLLSHGSFSLVLSSSPRSGLSAPCVSLLGCGQVDCLGERTFNTPLRLHDDVFVDDDTRIPYARTAHDGDGSEGWVRSFRVAGPTRRIFFRPDQVNVGVITCGGLCPGLNDVIRAITFCASQLYGARVFGFRYGYQGLTRAGATETIRLTADRVGDVHTHGGTLLGTSRGSQDPSEMVDVLLDKNISILMCVGGDGTLAGAKKVCDEIKKRQLKIAVVGVPKTIDNDISFTDKTFGFDTAVGVAVDAIRAGYAEARSHEYGIGLVRLMGRHCGFIAAHASMASSTIPVSLEEIYVHLQKRFERKKYAVVVVAEGFGQDLLEAAGGRDASGNVKLADVGVYLKGRLEAFLKVRSVTCNTADAGFCASLANNAVHAAMAGFTNCVVGSWAEAFTLVPISLAISERKQVNPVGQVWRTVSEMTADRAQGADPDDPDQRIQTREESLGQTAAHITATREATALRGQNLQLQKDAKCRRCQLCLLSVAAGVALGAAVFFRWRSR